MMEEQGRGAIARTAARPVARRNAGRMPPFPRGHPGPFSAAIWFLGELSGPGGLDSSPRNHLAAEKWPGVGPRRSVSWLVVAGLAWEGRALPHQLALGAAAAAP
jgi:hypothetical protein